MNQTLYNWLTDWNKKRNIKKYWKYSDDWISNLTESQIIGFGNMMRQEKYHEFLRSWGIEV